MHEFTLIIDGVNVTTEAANALYEAGCNDALFGRQNGRTTLDFCREAPTRTFAILSAIQDARRAGVKVLRVNHSMPADRGTVAVNSALSLAWTHELDPQLFNEVMTMLPGTQGRRRRAGSLRVAGIRPRGRPRRLSLAAGSDVRNR